MTTNKEASFIAPNATLPETLAASLAIGGGSFATMRLLHELMAQRKPKHDPGENDNSLTIDLPKTMMPNYMQAIQPQAQGMMPKQGGDNLNKILAIGGGVPAGFMGAKYLYDKYKEYQLQQELDLAKGRYMQAMTDFNNPEVTPAQLGMTHPQHQQEQQQQTPPPGMPTAPKFAQENTPGVDAFCEKLAEEFNKHGNLGSALSGLWSALPGTPNDPAHEALVQSSEDVFKGQGVRNIPSLLPFGMGGIMGDALALGGLATGAGTFAAMAMANKNRQEAEKKRQFPSSVEINYA